jgi:hypothetical protein
LTAVSILYISHLPPFFLELGGKALNIWKVNMVFRGLFGVLSWYSMTFQDLDRTMAVYINPSTHLALCLILCWCYFKFKMKKVWSLKFLCLVEHGIVQWLVTDRFLVQITDRSVNR